MAAVKSRGGADFSVAEVAVALHMIEKEIATSQETIRKLVTFPKYILPQVLWSFISGLEQPSELSIMFGPGFVELGEWCLERTL